MDIARKEDLEYLVSEYQRTFEKAEPTFKPQGHAVTPGRPWDRCRALEVAAHLMQQSVALYDSNPERAFELYCIGRGIALSQGEVPEGGILIPEPNAPGSNKQM